MRGFDAALALAALGLCVVACGSDGAGSETAGVAGTTTTTAGAGGATTSVGETSTATTGGGGAGGVGGKADVPALRVMTYNIKHAELSSLEAIADVILAANPDVVALQEVDQDAQRSGNVDQAYRLGQLTGMASSFRTAITLGGGGNYGLAVLSRYPILTSEKLNLTSTGEQRILVVWRIAYPDIDLAFANTHLGLQAAEREMQANQAAAMLANEPFAILLGDLNEEPGGAVDTTLSALLTDAWLVGGDGTEGHTIPATTPNRRIDFIYYAAGWIAAQNAHVVNTTASDHRPLVTELTLP